MFLAGRLIDRFGVRIMLATGCVLLGAAALWMTTVNHPAQAYVGIAALRTFGQGTLPLVATTMVALWFLRKRGKTIAIASLGAALSQAVFPLLALYLISRFGWRNAWIGLALVVWVVLLLPAILLVRRDPESVGLQPDGVPLPTGTGMRSGKAPGRVETDFTLKEALRTKAFWLLLAAGMAMPLILTGLTLHHVPLMEEKGVSAAIGAAAFSLFGPMMLVGNFAGGLLCDRIQNRYVLATGQLLYMGTMLFTFAISQPWHAFLYMTFSGVSFGIIMTTNAVIWPNYFGRSELGSIRGLSATAGIGFSALGALPFGFVFDMTGSYDKAILILLVLPVICAVAALLAVKPKKRSEKAVAGSVTQIAPPAPGERT